MSVNILTENGLKKVDGGAASEAKGIAYNPTTSGLAADDVQEAIDEINGNLSDKQDKTDNGIKTVAKTVVGAINELLNKFTNYYTKTEVNEKISHIGMIIHSTTLDTEDKVKAIYGGTSWSLIEGRMLLGVSSSHTVNTTGGSETHTLAVENLPSHTHSIPALSGTAVGGNHTHGVESDGATLGGIFNKTLPSMGGENSFPNGVRAIKIAYSGNLTLGVVTNASTTGATGSGTAFDTMPPYKTVYMWERTA